MLHIGYAGEHRSPVLQSSASAHETVQPLLNSHWDCHCVCWFDTSAATYSCRRAQLEAQVCQGNHDGKALPYIARITSSLRSQFTLYLTVWAVEPLVTHQTSWLESTTTAFYATGLVADSGSLHGCNSILTAHFHPCRTSVLHSPVPLNQTAAEQKLLFLPNSKTPIHFQKMAKAAKLLACLHCHRDASTWIMVAATIAY